MSGDNNNNNNNGPQAAKEKEKHPEAEQYKTQANDLFNSECQPSSPCPLTNRTFPRPQRKTTSRA